MSLKPHANIYSDLSSTHALTEKKKKCGQHTSMKCSTCFMRGTCVALVSNKYRPKIVCLDSRMSSKSAIVRRDPAWRTQQLSRLTFPATSYHSRCTLIFFSCYVFHHNLILSFNLPPPPPEMKDLSVLLTDGDRVGVCGVNQHLLCSNLFKNSAAGRCSEGADSYRLHGDV